MSKRVIIIVENFGNQARGGMVEKATWHEQRGERRINGGKLEGNEREGERQRKGEGEGGREEWDRMENTLTTFKYQKGHFRPILFALKKKKKKRSKCRNYKKAKFSCPASLAKVTLLLLKVFKKKLENFPQDWLEDPFLVVGLLFEL